jgi:signal transduction histidine kinase/ActR/RegA family two-component response regulator
MQVFVDSALQAMQFPLLLPYSAVITEALTALLLAGALSVLGRFYPRSYLRLWAGAWFAEALHIAVALAAHVLRVQQEMVGFLPALASWVSLAAGVSHAALLVLGGLALFRTWDSVGRSWLLTMICAALLALLPVWFTSDAAVADAERIRIFVRVGMLSGVAALAAFGTGVLISRASTRAPALGFRWMSWVLLAVGVHRTLLTLYATGQVSLLPEVAFTMPLIDCLLLTALGIGTAIAMVEDEQVHIQQAAELRIDAERRARTSGTSLVTALAAVADLVAVIGADGGLSAWNPAFEQYVRKRTGAPPVVGARLLQMIPSGTAEEWAPRVAALLEGLEQAFETSVDLLEGAPDYFDVSARPMRDGDDVVGGVIVARDVTERRKLEQQLQQAQRLDTVGRLAGGIAHDFNNLLTAILSSASMARESLPKDHDVQADLADVQLAGERATQLTRQLLAFARRQPVSQQPIELNDHVANMERMLSRLVGPDVGLLVTLGEALWHVRADGPQLEQVLVNLAVNARDAMPHGGRLSIRTANRTISDGTIVMPRPMPAGDYVEIVLSDDGSGMDEETLAHVFEPFYTTKPVGQGTGLGLAMCYGIVRQHHGVIWIESSLGRGTTVFILLPRYEGPLPEVGARPVSLTPTPSTSGTETVLLVEDEPQVRAVAARSLRSAGYRVLEATNGRDGVQVARRERDAIDLIVTDVVMPEMGGKEMVELARTFMPHVAVLFVSGYTAGTFPQSNDDPSASMFLQKPFTPQELLAMVREVLDRHAPARPVAETS